MSAWQTLYTSIGLIFSSAEALLGALLLLASQPLSRALLARKRHAPQRAGSLLFVGWSTATAGLALYANALCVAGLDRKSAFLAFPVLPGVALTLFFVSIAVDSVLVRRQFRRRL